MHYQKRFLLLFLIAGLVVFLALGCKPVGENGIDREAFQALEEYIYQIVPAVEDAKYDIDQWVGEVSDPQMLGWLECDAELIAEINERHLEGKFPDTSTIETWEAVSVTRGDCEWTIKGEELAPLVGKIRSAAEELAVQLQNISGAGEKTTEKMKSDLGKTVEEAYQAALQLRSMFGFEK